MKKTISAILLFIIFISFCSCTPSRESMKKLNKKWECDYLSFNVNSKWDLNEGDGSANQAFGLWTWADSEGQNYIRFTVYYSDLYKKLSDYETRSYYNSHKNTDDMKSESSFVINNQAYIVISKPKNSDTNKIIFFADKLYGSFEYAYYDESIVKEIVKSISFK